MSFQQVVDPAAGSYFIENLTISIATQAWELFLKVEDEGGMLEAVKAGKVQEAINASNKARHDSVSNAKKFYWVPTNILTSMKKQAKRLL